MVSAERVAPVTPDNIVLTMTLQEATDLRWVLASVPGGSLSPTSPFLRSLEDVRLALATVGVSYTFAQAQHS